MKTDRNHRLSQVFLVGVVLVLLVAVYATSVSIDASREKAGIGARRVILGGRFVGPTLLGFADVVADALWLVANEYFWNKEYLKLVPLFRSITWLDPHYILVYRIGGWHLAYNLRHVIDCSERKAREFVRAGIKFLEEGIANNPHKYDLYFELGWLYFEKVGNYKLAAGYFEEAVKLEHPAYVNRMLAHSYRRSGQLRKSLEEWGRIVEANPDDKTAVKYHRRLKELLP
jgi:tetratricopeptide (TPR) repeat protein